MRRATIAMALMAVGYAAEAQAKAADTGLTLGARLAYGFSLGDAGKSLPLTDYAAGSVPVLLEVGYRFTRQLSAGAYFQYAYASTGGSICEAIPPAVRTSGSYCTSASGYVLRYGIEGAFRFPLGAMRGWAGLGIGGESAKLTTTAHIPALPGTYQAFNGSLDVGRSTDLVGEVSLNGGVEWPITGALSIGPFLTVTFARYTQATFSPNQWGLPAGTPSSEQSWHEWLILGAKGTYDL